MSVVLPGQIEQGSKPNCPVLFEPNCTVFNQTDLLVETVLISPGNKSMVRVTVCNNLSESKQLEAELNIGEVEACYPTAHYLVWDTPDGNVDGGDTAMNEAFETADIYKVSSIVLESVETLSTDD